MGSAHILGRVKRVTIRYQGGLIEEEGRKKGSSCQNQGREGSYVCRLRGIFNHRHVKSDSG